MKNQIQKNALRVQRPLPAFCALPLGAGMALYSFSSGRFIEFAISANALLAFCFLYAWFSRYFVRFEMHAPARMQEGGEGQFTFLIQSQFRFPRFVSASIMEAAHPAATGSKKPGPTHRHKLSYVPTERIFSRGKDSEEEHEYSMDGFIHFRERSRIRRTLQCPDRGLLHINSLRLYFTDPLGIFAVPRTFHVEQDILIRVRPTAGSSLLNLTRAAGRFDTTIQVGQTGERTEYAGTRPYRPGDELRHIHWPTVARTGELHVREYTATSADALLVLLVRDAHREIDPYWSRPPYGEFMLRTATAMVLELFQRHTQVAFGANIGAGYAVEIGGSRHYLQAFHDYASATYWNVRATQEMAWLESIEMTGASAPNAVLFAVDSPALQTLSQITGVLQQRFDRITVVTGENADQIARLPGVQVRICDPTQPQTFFEQLEI